VTFMWDVARATLRVIARAHMQLYNFEFLQGRPALPSVLLNRPLKKDHIPDHMQSGRRIT